VRDAGLPHAVVSSSTNCKDVLQAAGIAEFFDHIVDGHVTEQDHLHGKPAPDTYLAGAKLIGVEPAAAAVFEDALSGVAAGHAGSFGVVVGVNRVGQHDALLANGATMVVDDLGDLLK
jgi:HAD superfamily hydrolase (TIGR01509 family)